MKRLELKKIIKEIIGYDIKGKSPMYVKGYRQGMNDHFDQNEQDVSHQPTDYQEGYKKGYSSARWQKWSDRIGKAAAWVGDIAGHGFQK